MDAPRLQPAHAAEILGESPEIEEVRRLIRRCARWDAPVLVLGESGTGKELVARAIHNESRRSSAPLEILNCGAIPETLIDSELFGHERGAFTGAYSSRKGIFERASGGSAFLDEFGELAPAVQVRLLRVLQDGVVQRVGGEERVQTNARIICATNKDLHAEVEAGRFRGDLHYRVADGVIELPPLRDRGDDVLLLAEHFATELGLELRDVERVLCSYTWPGNVRQLRSTIRRAAMMFADGDIVTGRNLEDAIRAFDPRVAFEPRFSGDAEEAVLAFSEACSGEFSIKDAMGATGFGRTAVREAIIRFADEGVFARARQVRGGGWSYRRVRL